MMEVTNNLPGGRNLVFKDYRNLLEDYRMLNKIEFSAEKPPFIPEIDEDFFAAQQYSIPVVRMDSKSYIFPTNAKKTDKTSNVDDYINFCVTDLDILVATQNYYYHRAKMKYEHNPVISQRYKFKDGKPALENYNKAFRKRGSNSMSFVQYNLSKFVHDEHKIWEIHRELQNEMKFKQNDLKLQIEESESTFAKGEFTSYGSKNLNTALFDEYGVRVKLQNGSNITNHDILEIKKGLESFFQTVKNLKPLFSEFDMIISYSKEKYMHGRDSSGLFYPYFHAIGVSNIGRLEQNLAHEIGHFIDYHLGSRNKRHYSSDDNNSLSGQIAYLFRRNTLKRQHSEYQNRTTECFARAIEQYYSLKTDIEIPNSKGNYCDAIIFNEKITPLLHDLISKI